MQEVANENEIAEKTKSNCRFVVDEFVSVSSDSESYRGIVKGFVPDGDKDKAIIQQLRTDERLNPNPPTILVNTSDLVKLSPAESRTAKRTYKNKRSVEQGIPVLSSKGDTESLSAGKAGTTVEKPSGWSISHPLLIRFLFHELPLI